MFENTINSNQQGNIGMAYAIAYYSKLGYNISIPLTDSQDYDIIVDTGSSLLKVQIKTTKSLSDNGNFICNLAVKTKRQGENARKGFDQNDSDLLFILTDDGTCYSIPTSEINARSAITLGDKYSIFKVSLF